MRKRIARAQVVALKNYAELMRRIIALLLATAVSSLALFPEDEPKPDFEIKILKVGVERGIFHLRGIAKNISGHTCTMGEISYNVFDAEGNAIGTLVAAKPNFQAGGTWRFDAVSGSNEGRYELIAANCY
jgi:hypothetical protein